MVYKHALSFIESNRRKEPDGTLSSIEEGVSLDNVPAKPGVYIVLSDKEKFLYPSKKSRVIYIGMSKNLKSRIMTHSKSFNSLKSLPKSQRKNYWYYSRYNYMVAFGCQIVWFTRRGTQSIKDLESTLIEDFYNKHHAIPIGNGAFSFKKIL